MHLQGSLVLWLCLLLQGHLPLQCPQKLCVGEAAAVRQTFASLNMWGGHQRGMQWPCAALVTPMQSVLQLLAVCMLACSNSHRSTACA